MIALAKILPGTGRGTSEAGGGARAAWPALSPLRHAEGAPPPSCGWSPSPCRGGFATVPQTTPVTLNSFQGPSLPTRRSVVGRRNGAVGVSTRATGSAARWTLKQVQHDDGILGALR